uniref:Uncharacterized protein n=1 Tax=Tanacetum cinerariifolium TaxID=118510 RepID=A0A6L2K9W0_TANCI|nr:hypothetical protein [Tanacetum cinerariifolium]
MKSGAVKSFPGSFSERGCNGSVYRSFTAEGALKRTRMLVDSILAATIAVNCLSDLTSETAQRKYQGSNCGIIDWFDQPMFDPVVQIIPGLLRTMNDLQAINAHYHAQASNAENHVEATIANYRYEARRMKILLVLSWLGFVFFYLVN